MLLKDDMVGVRVDVEDVRAQIAGIEIGRGAIMRFRPCWPGVTGRVAKSSPHIPVVTFDSADCSAVVSLFTFFLERPAGR